MFFFGTQCSNKTQTNDVLDEMVKLTIPQVFLAFFCIWSNKAYSCSNAEGMVGSLFVCLFICISVISVIIDFVGNLLLFPAVKEFCKSVKNWQSYRHEYGVIRFWGHSVVLGPCSRRGSSCQGTGRFGASGRQKTWWSYTDLIWRWQGADLGRDNHLFNNWLFWR